MYRVDRGRRVDSGPGDAEGSAPAHREIIESRRRLENASDRKRQREIPERRIRALVRHRREERRPHTLEERGSIRGDARPHVEQAPDLWRREDLHLLHFHPWPLDVLRRVRI